MFTFDNDYENAEQVRAFMPDFLKVLAELEAADQYRYNTRFKGRIPGIEGPDEDTAIYLLQGLERQDRQDEKVAKLVADGYSEPTAEDGIRKFQHIVLYPTRRMGGEFAEWRDARLIVRDGQPYAILPKGKRTNGHLVGGRAVLVA